MDLTDITSKQYLDRAEALSKKHSSDGCTVFFSDWLHDRMKHSRLICMAHDFGSRGLIDGVSPGWNNNAQFFKANWDQGYRLWGVLSYIVSLPYAVVRYNLGVPIGVGMFHVYLFSILGFALLVHFHD